MAVPTSYTEFWARVFNPIRDLLGGITFEEFLRDPWGYLVLIADESSPHGALLALATLSAFWDRSEIAIHPNDRVMDLGEMADVAGKVVSGTVGVAASRNLGTKRWYVLH